MSKKRRGRKEKERTIEWKGVFMFTRRRERITISLMAKNLDAGEPTGKTKGNKSCEDVSLDSLLLYFF